MCVVPLHAFIVCAADHTEVVSSGYNLMLEGCVVLCPACAVGLIVDFGSQNDGLMCSCSKSSSSSLQAACCSHQQAE